MSDPASSQTSFCFPGDQNDMGSITSLTKTDQNQDFCTEGVTKGVEDDIPDDDCILSEKEFNIETSVSDKVCDDSVNDNSSSTMKNKADNIKEESFSKFGMALQDQQSGDDVSDISPESIPATSLLVKDTNKNNINAENTKLHYDKYETNCQMKEESFQHPNKAPRDKKSQVGTDVLKAQSDISSCSMKTEERANCSHNSSGKNNENHIYKKSVIIETIMNILNRNQKQLENNMSLSGNVTTNGKSQTVDNKRTNKGYFQSLSSLLSAAPSETPSSNTEGRKFQRSSEKLVFDAVQVKKQLKSGVERVMSQLEKLQQALCVLQFKTDDSFALMTSESLKNQIKGMMTAVKQMYHIVYNTPQNNLSFLDTLNQMATQLIKVEEEILKCQNTTKDPVTYFLNFQEIIDRLREGGVKSKDTVFHDI